MNQFLTTELIGKSSRLLHNNLGQKLKLAALGITSEQWIILQILSAGVRTQKELGEITLKNKASINSLISNLLKLNLVIKTISSKDKRATEISISKIGNEVRKQAMKSAQESVNHAFNGFSELEIEQLNELLKRVNNNLIDNK